VIFMRYKDQIKRHKIKNAVVNVVLKNGFHGASVSKIAKEAGVSPATIYIYFENKYQMFQSVYIEYTQDFYNYIFENLNTAEYGEEIVEKLILSLYSYIKENELVFRFIDQYKNCPALSLDCNGVNGVTKIMNLLFELEESGIIKKINTKNVYTIIFGPIKTLALNFRTDSETEEMLDELIVLIKEMLLM